MYSRRSQRPACSKYNLGDQAEVQKLRAGSGLPPPGMGHSQNRRWNKMLAGSLEKQPSGSGHSNQTAIPFPSQGTRAGHSTSSSAPGMEKELGDHSWEPWLGQEPAAQPSRSRDTSEELFQRCGRDLGTRICTANSKEGHGSCRLSQARQVQPSGEELYLPLTTVDEECCSWKARPPSKAESESWNQGRSIS